MNVMHNAKIIYSALYENKIVFRLAFLLPEILSLCLFEPQQVRLGLTLLIQIGRFPSVSVTTSSKPYPVHREKTENVD
jgi:hypothetical protein